MFCVMNEITWVTNHDFCLPVLWRQRASSEAAIFSRCCHTSGHNSSIQIVQVRITWSSAHLIRYLPAKGDINCDVNRMFLMTCANHVYFFVVCDSNERHSSVVGCGWTHAHLRRHRKIRLGQGHVYLFLLLSCLYITIMTLKNSMPMHSCKTLLWQCFISKSPIKKMPWTLTYWKIYIILKLRRQCLTKINTVLFCPIYIFTWIFVVARRPFFMYRHGISW